MSPVRAWETVSSRLVLDGSPWLRVWEERVRLPSGRVIEPFYRYRKNDFASVFATDGEGRVLVERRYRHGPQAFTLDMPAGYIEPGEAPEAAARRELLEETGYEAARWSGLGSVTVDGNSGGARCHLFLARDARRVAEPAEDDTEEAEVLLVEPRELRARLDAGEFLTLVGSSCAARGLLAIEGDAR